MRLINLAAALLLIPVSSYAQGNDPASAPPDNYRILLENDYVRVVRYLHAPPASVPYAFDGRSVRYTQGDTLVVFEIKKIDTNAVPLAEDPFANNPKTLKVLLENDSVRVMEAAIPPAWKEKQHSHPPYVTYILKGGSVKMHFADGTTRDVQFNTGEAKFTAPVTHWAESTSADTVKIVLVELRHK